MASGWKVGGNRLDMIVEGWKEEPGRGHETGRADRSTENLFPTSGRQVCKP